jgi:hypothetical protein
MDVFTLLRRDHETVSSLFAQIMRGFGESDTPERHRLFRQLKRELELHAAVEDLHVYRVFQQADSTRDDAHDALDAHAKIKTLLDILASAAVYDHTWVPKFQELHQLVQQHVALEENEMFPPGFIRECTVEEIFVAPLGCSQRCSSGLPLPLPGGTLTDLVTV